MQPHLSEEELSRKLADAGTQIEVSATYKHYKGSLYKVTSLAILEATNEVAVVYQAQYGTGVMFVRPVSSWLEPATVDGQTVERFSKIQ